jgi:putative ABC transport system substrate-binding protein
MRRRDLLVGLAAIPSTAHAQERRASIGLLATGEPPARAVEALRDGMRQRGYIEGHGLTLDVRVLTGSPEGNLRLAADMAGSGAEVIVAFGTPAALLARRATPTKPVVMVGVGDPIGSGLIASLARPGGNVTGLANLGRDISAKQVELFIETVPGLKRIGIVQNQANPASAAQSREAQEAMRALKLVPRVVDAVSAEQYEAALLQLSRDGVEGVFFVPDPVALTNRRAIGERAIASGLPTMFQRRENVEAGGLMSYGSSLADQFRRTADYVDRILKGARPADLPVEQPTSFEFVLNLGTAKALGLTLSPSIQTRADETIE